MSRFSERTGVVKPDRALQVDSMSDALRNSLWNLFVELYEDQHDRYWKPIAQHIAKHFRKVPVDGLPRHDDELRQWVKNYFFNLLWYEAYDLVEFVIRNHRRMTAISYPTRAVISYHSVDTNRVIAVVNAILERELSGFRFLQGTLAPITDPVEVSEIEDAAEASRRVGLLGVQEHIRSAVQLFGRKPNPDYRNAIKEAISAVESVVKLITSSESGTLDAALKELASKVDLHSALTSGFSKLYGFTSDEDGIRHAILDQPSVGFAEAKYMIVACSAFVNFLIVKAEKVGLLKQG